jgi:hypothetical protein
MLWCRHKEVVLDFNVVPGCLKQLELKVAENCGYREQQLGIRKADEKISASLGQSYWSCLT